MMQQPKIVLGFAYTRCRANSRYNFWKRSRLSKKKREKERVTPEFGERKEEKKSTPIFRALQQSRISIKGSHLSLISLPEARWWNGQSGNGSGRWNNGSWSGGGGGYGGSGGWL
jgi:uncharacterized membrane protein YgcG